MRPSTRAALSRVVLVAVALVCAAGLRPARAQQYLVRNYTEMDGLPDPEVHAVVQAPDGLIWVATRGGPASFDGSRWFGYGGEVGLREFDVADLACDDGGTPWVVSATLPVRISRLEGEEWILRTSCALPGGRVVAAMSLTGEGPGVRALVALDDGSLHHWRADTDRWTEVRVVERRGPVARIEFVRDRFLIVSDHRLFELDPDGDRPPRELEGPFETICSLHFDAERDRLFTFGPHGIAVSEGDGETRSWLERSFDHSPQVPCSMRATADVAGGLYFGTMDRLLHAAPGRETEELDASSGLVTAGVTCLTTDREGNVWVGSPRGLSKIVSRRFASYDARHGLFDDEVTACAELPDGTVVLGHEAGLTYIEDPPRAVELVRGLPVSRMMDIEVGADGTLWLALEWSGILELRPDGTRVEHGVDSGLRLPVNSVRVDERGRVWAGGSCGIFLREDDRFVFQHALRTPEGTVPNVRAMNRDRDGGLLASSSNCGILGWDSSLERVFNASDPDAVLRRSTFAAHRLADGQLWVGSTDGLLCVEGDRLVPCEEPRIARPVYFIEEGADGAVWIGTNNGAFLWSEGELRHFTIHHGLAGLETNRAAGMLDRRGRFWIGTNRGVSVYRPDQDFVRPSPPSAEVVSVETLGGAFRAAGVSRILTQGNMLEFDYRAIAFVDESRVRFQTRLAGLESEWSEPVLSHERRTCYSYVPPGEYTFMVRAVDVEGRVSEPASAPLVVIRQPFWRTVWFRVLGLVGALVVLSAVLSYLFQRRHAGRLEAEVDARTRELAETRAEIELDKQRLEQTLSSINDGVAAITTDGIVVLWNPAARDMTGWLPEEAAGKPLHELLGTDEIDLRQEHELVLEGRDRFGERRLYDVSSSPTSGEDASAPAVVVAFRDVTDKLAADREHARIERLESLGLLAGGIAHDFNNLLTVILGNLAMLQDSRGDAAEFEESLRDATAAARSARSLTRQLMTFSRGGEPVRQSASVADVLSDTSSFFLSGANVRCTIDVPDDLWLVDIDTGQIAQVFHNLMLNAREAMPNGGTVRVRAWNLEKCPPFLDAERCVVIEVQDEGVGIRDEDVPHVFDPYFSTKARGSGLGLAIAYSIVQRHDGHITVESRPGVGSTFRIYLPASCSTELPAPPPDLVPRPRRGARILVMDDEAAILRVVSSMLRESGYLATCTRDGHEAIEAFERARSEGRPFDAVIMDLTVPGAMGGRETVRRLLMLDPDVRAIVASGYSNDPVMSRASEFGFCAEVTKPFGSEELTAVLDRVLSGGA